ncbi:uncharacterized protein LOC130668488 [Microplitis mediator]|uniref:uncharacterized protein LOC130668488 n=1 Tax=Microplitis mediator TaxID=375433 RepID=UPI0025521F30|nr:uncharacterized protein LOC130668488 [Microplitis mediator]
MKLLVFTVVVIVLFSFSPSRKANPCVWDTMPSRFMTPDDSPDPVICSMCTAHQVCLSEEKREWKCTSFGYAGCAWASDWNSSERKIKCNKPNTHVFYKNGGYTFDYDNRNSQINLWG